MRRTPRLARFPSSCSTRWRNLLPGGHSGPHPDIFRLIPWRGVRMDVTEPVVRTAAGQVRGRDENGVAVFRGIPFAQPPVGDAAVRRPGAGPALGRRAGRGHVRAAPAAVRVPAHADRAGRAPDADPDDWLTVNVFSPDLGAAGLPVMVWIYGGAYRFGSSGLVGYDGSALARRGRRGGDLQPPGRRGGLRLPARRPGQPGAARPGGGAALGPGEHRRVRRRPRAGDRVRRVGRGRRDRVAARHAGRGRACSGARSRRACPARSSRRRWRPTSPPPSPPRPGCPRPPRRSRPPTRPG